MQVTVYMPYPHFRPRLKLQSMQRPAAVEAAGPLADVLAQAEASVEATVLGKLQHAHQCLGYLMCQALFAMEGLRTSTS